MVVSIIPDGSSVNVLASELDYSGAVDRVLVHRRNRDELFLCDAVEWGSGGFLAGALLPWGHRHYSGHTGPSRFRDPMLLLECVRQAETFVAHTLFGVEVGARFVLRSWSGEFAPVVAPVAGPSELLMVGSTCNLRVVGGRTRGLDYEIELWLGDARVGRVDMRVGYLSAAAYAAVRSRKHGDSLPSSDEPVPVFGCPVAPVRVGRVRATDTLLLEVAAEAAAVRAVLRVPTENPSLFDHVQDHVPAMVLVEAARQLAALAVRQWGGAGPDRTQMVAMSSSFAAYAELGEPVEMVATPAGGVAGVQDGSVGVVFRQGGGEIARTRIVMAVPDRCRGKGAG